MAFIYIYFFSRKVYFPRRSERSWWKNSTMNKVIDVFMLRGMHRLRYIIWIYFRRKYVRRWSPHQFVQFCNFYVRNIMNRALMHATHSWICSFLHMDADRTYGLHISAFLRLFRLIAKIAYVSRCSSRLASTAFYSLRKTFTALRDQSLAYFRNIFQHVFYRRDIYSIIRTDIAICFHL